jgi:hypothetical protein
VAVPEPITEPVVESLPKPVLLPERKLVYKPPVIKTKLVKQSRPVVVPVKKPEPKPVELVSPVCLDKCLGVLSSDVIGPKLYNWVSSSKKECSLDGPLSSTEALVTRVIHCIECS